MSEDLLRLGVVRLKLVDDDEMSVRASDIIACIGPSEEKQIRDGLVAAAQARNEAEALRLERLMVEAAVTGRGVMAQTAGVLDGVTNALRAGATITANRLTPYNQAYAIAGSPTRTRIVLLRSVQQVYCVTNSREEIEGWMRDE
jgi:hypothetical protein